MFIDLAANHFFGAPAERNPRIDEYDEPYISLRWSELPFRIEEPITFGPSGLSDLFESLRDCASTRNPL